MSRKAAAFARYRAGDECPECGESDPQLIEDNGAPLAHRTFRCMGCACQWGREQFLD